MRNKLNKLLNNSYSPYSNYKVCAIVVTNDKEIREYKLSDLMPESFRM